MALISSSVGRRKSGFSTHQLESIPNLKEKKEKDEILILTLAHLQAHCQFIIYHPSSVFYNLQTLEIQNQELGDTWRPAFHWG